MTTRTGFAVSAAMRGRLARSRIHLARPVALRLFSAIGAEHLFVTIFDELFKLLSAGGTSVL